MYKEKGVTQNVKPQQVVGLADHVPHVLMSEKSRTTIIIGCGARMRQKLLEGAVPGTNGNFNDYQKLLSMYDGHMTHITPDIIDWPLANL
ncbi:hypothetical protein KUTeg_000928 [Tegillarca granosa]|uniref:Uncharacterized protein n=1 Tax=Tegillarca granosa TaxID=220873 RepID=A0ABQ9FWA9_TEGGR|nr:hypothetical protein KUTeg_000928 [Tegillarca granosa]